MYTIFHKLPHFQARNDYEVVTVIFIYLFSKHLMGTCFMVGNTLDSRV